MRPIERGNPPANNAGEDKTYSRYQAARGDLLDKLGNYCSYCEMRLDSALAVEHVKPKKPDGAAELIRDRELDWHNFLLSCTNCNSTKGNTDVEIGDYLWPDINNTFKAIEYCEEGIVRPADNLEGDLKVKAEAIINLVGLDKTPAKDAEVKDRRWKKRRSTWHRALRALNRLRENDCQAMREQIIETAEENGLWSIWMTVFDDDVDIKRRLICSPSYKGTARNCFDANTNALVRNPNVI